MWKCFQIKSTQLFRWLALVITRGLFSKKHPGFRSREYLVEAVHWMKFCIFSVDKLSVIKVVTARMPSTSTFVTFEGKRYGGMGLDPDIKAGRIWRVATRRRFKEPFWTVVWDILIIRYAIVFSFKVGGVFSNLNWEMGESCTPT